MVESGVDPAAVDPMFEVSAQRPNDPPCVALPPPPPSGAMRLQPVFVGDGAGERPLTKLVDFVAIPEVSGRFFAAQQTGQILRLQSDHPAEVVLDLSASIFEASSESGVVSIAVHPGFADNGYLFVVYSTAGGSQKFLSRLSRFTVSENGPAAPDSEVVILDIEQSNPAHTGNHILFGPDGYLYYAVGDDRRTQVHAQDIDTLQGKVLRLDVDQPDEARATPYRAPPDNPFLDVGAPEVFAYGLRNPWRLSLDPVTGEMFVGDVGQDRREEMSRLLSGANYGWPMREGTLCFSQDPCESPDLTEPLVELSHPMARSVVPGTTYTKEDIPELRGRTLVADYASGTIWSFDLAAERPELKQELEGSFPIVSFSKTDDGTVYAVRYETKGNQGGIYRMVPNEETASDFPRRLSETGCVDVEDPRKPGPALQAYEPISALWSDGADKTRYFAMPSAGRIHVGEDGDFHFPNGTVLVKHFSMDDTLHETRLLMLYQGTWTGYSYRWNEDQTDALLLEGALDANLESGQRWHFPSRSECNQCHTSAAGHSLGLEFAQLDHDGSFGQNQLERLWERDAFEPMFGSLSVWRKALSPLVDPSDEESAIDSRARSYLHANCANCHRPDGPGRGDIDLSISVDLREINACDEKPRVSGVWDEGNWDAQRIIARGRKEDSVLWMRMSLLGHFRMPNLGSETVDPLGLGVVGQWIDELESCGAEPQQDGAAAMCSTAPGFCPGSDRCWDLAYGCDECAARRVWREIPDAPDGDHICVNSSARDRVREENELHAERVEDPQQPGAPCLSGYVWREAYPMDYVCVPVSSRTAAAEENASHFANTKVGRQP